MTERNIENREKKKRKTKLHQKMIEWKCNKSQGKCLSVMKKWTVYTVYITLSPHYDSLNTESTFRPDISDKPQSHSFLP